MYYTTFAQRRPITNDRLQPIATTSHRLPLLKAVVLPSQLALSTDYIASYEKKIFFVLLLNHYITTYTFATFLCKKHGMKKCCNKKRKYNFIKKLMHKSNIKNKTKILNEQLRKVTANNKIAKNTIKDLQHICNLRPTKIVQQTICQPTTEINLQINPHQTTHRRGRQHIKQRL